MKFACLIVVYWFLDDRHCVYVKDDNAREWDDADCDSNKHTLCEIGTISAEFAAFCGNIKLVPLNVS